MTRDHKTSVSGPNYVMHLPRLHGALVWCGRKRSEVNSYPDNYVTPDPPEEQTCLACLKAWDRAGKISPEPA